MKYSKLANKIVVEDLSQFNTSQIFDCGQIFRYNINQNVAEVISADKYAKVITFENKIEILTKHVDYFENFFDLNRDYNAIKEKLMGDNFLAPCISYGYGIRILNQDVFEMIVSFIVSANNNIKRIKNSLNHLSKKFGTKLTIDLDDDLKMDEYNNVHISSPLSEINNGRIEYYAFPTLSQLKHATVQDYIDAGLGYRAQYMYETIGRLSCEDIANLDVMSYDDRLKFLLSLKGVGEKVAHCIMLFSMHETKAFPVDTWINKVYNNINGTNISNRKQISLELTGKYKNLSGYAQQYFFYYYRDNNIG